MISKRHFFHVPGFDPYDAAYQYRRFIRESARFQSTWNVSIAVSELRNPDLGEGHWTVVTHGPGWNVETCYEILYWHDIVCADLSRPELSRYGKALSLRQAQWDAISLRAGAMRFSFSCRSST